MINVVKLLKSCQQKLSLASVLMVSAVMFTLASCSYLPDERVYEQVKIPQNWHKTQKSQSATNINKEAQLTTAAAKVNLSQYNNLLAPISNNELNNLIRFMLANNPSFQGLKQSLKQSENTFDVNDANLYPKLSAGFKLSREKDDGDPSEYSSSAKISAGASYVIDIWGALSDQRKQGFYQYQKSKISFEQKKLAAIANLIKSYFALIHSQSALTIIEQQTDNLSERLVSIEIKYQQGLASLLDVYLAKNSLHSAKANLLKQRDKEAAQLRKLSLLLGNYPEPYLITAPQVQTIPSPVFPSRIPSEVMHYRADIQSAWLDVLINESSLAIAHKNRFPKLSLSAGVDRSDSELGSLFSNGLLNWNLAANLAAPIFDAGVLATKENNARLSLIKAEYNYANTTYSAFEQVEATLAKITTLADATKLDTLSLDNILKAEELANSQYQLGLIDFIKVLDAQKRAMAARLKELNNKLALFNASIDLYLALGGNINFSKELPKAVPIKTNESKASKKPQTEQKGISEKTITE